MISRLDFDNQNNDEIEISGVVEYAMFTFDLFECKEAHQRSPVDLQQEYSQDGFLYLAYKQS